MECDEDVLTRYNMMFSLLLRLQPLVGLAPREDGYARTKHKASREFNDFLAFLYSFLPYRAIEGVLSALA